MSEYDLRTKKALRQVTLLEYGFGPETMKRRKICPECGRANGAQDTVQVVFACQDGAGAAREHLRQLGCRPCHARRSRCPKRG